jgi:putative hydrolase
VSRHRLAFVTHPGLHMPVDTPELARACARRGTRMEISSAHRETNEAYVRAAAKEGVDFVLSSDAHRPERVGDLDAALRVAERAGLSPERVWNVERRPGRRSEQRPSLEV